MALQIQKNKNQQEGQAIVEFALALALFTPLLIIIGSLSIVLLAESYLNLDAYYLLRAHRYGNDIKRCEPSSLWPKNQFLEIRYKCLDLHSLTIEGESKLPPDIETSIYRSTLSLR